MILPTFERIEFFEFPQFLLVSIKFLIVGTRVTREPFHVDPEKKWSAVSTNLFECCRRGVINLLHVLSFDPPPIVRLENIQRERVGLARGHTDAVRVVFDQKEQG